jgi:hypothetical protein
MLTDDSWLGEFEKRWRRFCFVGLADDGARPREGRVGVLERRGSVAAIPGLGEFCSGDLRSGGWSGRETAPQQDLRSGDRSTMARGIYLEGDEIQVSYSPLSQGSKNAM